MLNLSRQQTKYYVRSYKCNCRVYGLQIVCPKPITENSDEFQERHTLNNTTFLSCKYNFLEKALLV